MTKILIVDDEQTNITILSKILSAHYEVIATCDSSEAMAIIDSESKPNIVLLDIVMPKMDGYEVCKRIKANPKTHDIQVIFASSLDTLEEQMYGVEIGADDYITKPVKADSLLLKITTCLKNQELLIEKHNSLASFQSNYEFAQTTAFTALSTISEMGNLSNFFKDLARISSIENLAAIILKLLQSFNLSGYLEIRHEKNEQIKTSTDEIDKPILFNILEKQKGNERIISYKNYTIINHAPISLLVTNMPINDENLYGRLKDHLATGIEGAAFGYEAIAQKSRVLDLLHIKEQQVSMIDSVLTFIKDFHDANEQSYIQAMSELDESISNAFMYLGLTEEQENNIIEIIENSDKKIQGILNKGTEVEKEILQLKSLIEQK